MYKLLVFIFVFSGCVATIHDVSYDFKHIESYELAGIQGEFDKDYTNLINVIIPDDMAKNKLVARFKLDGATLFIDDVEQISGVSVNDFNKDVKYTSVSYLNEVKEYFVRVKYFNEIPIIDFNKTIKVKNIDAVNVEFEFSISPVKELIGKMNRDVKYCIKYFIEDKNLLPSSNKKLMTIEEMDCTDFVNYDEIDKTIQLQAGKDIYLNIVAEAEGVKYLYNRLILKDNIEMFNGDCEDFMELIEDNKSYILNNDLVCLVVGYAGTYNYIYINGNGHSIYTMYNWFDNLNFSIITSLDVDYIDHIANIISFSLVENINIVNAYINKEQEAGIVADSLYDTTINNLNISGEILINGAEAGIITGKIINNLPFLETEINNVKIDGSVIGDSLIGGGVGFLISYTKFNNVEINATVVGNTYTGCLYGSAIDLPFLNNVIENCK